MAATIRQIADKVGVSTYTVSRVLRGQAQEARISEDCARRVLSAAQELDYRPHAAARAMRLRRSCQVGVVLRNNPGDRYTHPLAFETILGINEGLEKRGYLLSIIRVGDATDDTCPGSLVFRERLLDGLIILGRATEAIRERGEQLVRHCVWADEGLWEPQRCICRDERSAGRLAAQAAIERGYSELLWLGLRDDHAAHYSHGQRLAGVQEAATNAVPMEQLCLSAPMTVEIFNRIKPSTAVVAYSVYQARELAHLANQAGLLVGRDFGLVCCDDAHDIQRMWPGLCRVSFDRFGMGVLAAEMMISLLERPDEPCPSRLLEGALIAGPTAGGPPRRA